MNKSNNKDESLDDIQRFVESQRPENTNKKLQPKFLETVLCNHKPERKLDEISACEFNILFLCRFLQL